MTNAEWFELLDTVIANMKCLKSEIYAVDESLEEAERNLECAIDYLSSAYGDAHASLVSAHD